ncbi:MAG: response regulator transcription factor [Lachnospiraceae bacterium]|nr:response regulator transcription factor [Lachnospiraceae bacterium]
MDKVRVMVVDDQNISRNYFELYIENSERYELAFSLETASVADIYLLNNKIDLIIMDILMSDGSNGLEMAEKIKKNYPEIKIIAVTSMPEHSWIKKAKKIGIESFWYKESDKNNILEIMDKTMNGESVYPEKTPVVKLGMASSSEFTERELDVLRVITSGASNAIVAEKLGISENTVKAHVRSMLDKTGYRSRTELAIKARVAGLVICNDEN